MASEQQPAWFDSIASMKATMTSQGSHWFEPNTMRFFRSRVGEKLFGRRVFVTSEQHDDSSPRKYHLRLVEWSAQHGYGVATIGEFNADEDWLTLGQANSLASTLGAKVAELRTGAKLRHKHNGRLMEQFPAELQYGMSAAVAKWLSPKLPPGGSDDGWVFDGWFFSKRETEAGGGGE